MNICTKCTHYRTRRHGQIWHDQYCGHPGVRKGGSIDPVTGRAGYGPLHMDEPYPHAREVNKDGECHMHTKRPELTPTRRPQPVLVMTEPFAAPKDGARESLAEGFMHSVGFGIAMGVAAFTLLYFTGIIG